jgi:hypothetical protein
MSTKTYWLKFGSGDPRPNTGLSPTFLQFYDNTGATQSPPSISEIKYGGVTASGIYGFSYLISTTQSIYFLAYSVTTVSSGVSSDQYITGVIDPILAIDQSTAAYGTTNIALGTTNVYLGSTADLYLSAMSSSILAIGNTLLGVDQSAFIGSTASSIGTTSQDPTTVMGYLKRLQELLEGDQLYYAAGGTFMMFNRGALGNTTLLRTKTLLNSGGQVTRSGD